jgi:DNA-binding NarL/FixJ family response regulator
VTPIRVLLADDQALFREGLRALLALASDVRVVAEAADGEEALRLAGTEKPDVVLMDMKMPRLDGVAATRRMRVACPTCRVVALTTFDDDEYVFEALRAGAVGYLLKDAPSERLLEAIRAAARGEAFLQPSIASKVVAEIARLGPRSTVDAGLSDREAEVLRRLAHGASNKQIAASLFLSEGTVKNHVTSIFAKLGVADRTQAALRARELGLG